MSDPEHKTRELRAHLIERQNAEFDALAELAERWRVLRQVAVVDDDYPAERRRYEAALERFREALDANRPRERTDIQKIENSIAERSKRFRTFDDRSEHSRYMALALAGEVGELCNIVKKEWRGDPKGMDGKALLDEASDVFVYWTLFCHVHGWGIEKVMRHADAKAERKIQALEAARQELAR